MVINRDRVAKPKRPLEQNDNPRNKVRHNFLQAKAQPHTQSRHQPLQTRPVSTDQIGRPDQADKHHQVLEHCRDGITGAGRQIKPAEHGDFKRPRQVAHRDETGDQYRQRNQRIPERNDLRGLIRAATARLPEHQIVKRPTDRQ